jgi:nickel superoxide dismutase
MKKIVALSLLSALFVFCARPVSAHCEIPCGIYGDKTRVQLIEEHITTIEKSMKSIMDLARDGERNYNQIVRWVDNKETHAEMIQEIVYQYFMTQRIKPADKTEKAKYSQYTYQLTLLHKMLVHTMKAKQTTDLEHVEALRNLVAKFKDAYFGTDQGKVKKK